MTPTTPARPHHVFIVKVWYEPNGPDCGQWRGSVEHAQTGLRLFFLSLADLTDFIALHMRTEAAPETPGGPAEGGQ